MAYTQQQRLEAYNIFLETGSMTEVIKKTKIAEPTLFRWKKKEGWDDLVKNFKGKVRAKLEERGISRFVVKDENLLGVARILFQIGYDSIRPTITDDEGNKVPNMNRILPGSIGDVTNLFARVMAMQNEILGRTVEEEEQLDLTEEQIDGIYKIMLGKRDYDGDEDRRKAAEEFRNRQAQATTE